MKKTDEERIAKELADLIERRVQSIIHDDSQWKNAYLGIISYLEYLMEECKDDVIELQESNLPVKAVDAEGYRRAVADLYKEMTEHFRPSETINMGFSMACDFLLTLLWRDNYYL